MVELALAPTLFRRLRMSMCPTWDTYHRNHVQMPANSRIRKTEVIHKNHDNDDGRGANLSTFQDTNQTVGARSGKDLGARQAEGF